MIARIKKNAWGNWYGYYGRAKVAFFAETPTLTQEQVARAWLEDQRHANDQIRNLWTQKPIEL